MKRDITAVFLFLAMLIVGFIAISRQHEIDHLEATIDALSAKYRTVLARQAVVASNQKPDRSPLDPDTSPAGATVEETAPADDSVAIAPATSAE